MAATFDPTLSSKKDEVRDLIGDTDTDNVFLEDERIEAYLTLENDNVLDAAVRACRAIVAQLAREVNYQASTLRQDAAQAYQHYQSLLDELEAKSDKVFGAPIFVHSGDDERAPTFEIGQHDNQDQTRDEDEWKPLRDR